MDAETRRILITLAEDFADGIRTGRLDFTELEGRRIIEAVGVALNPRQVPRDICNISMACDYIGISQPTFRKHVREGRIPPGMKIAGFTELVWNKKDIERFKKGYFSKSRKEYN